MAGTAGNRESRIGNRCILWNASILAILLFGLFACASPSAPPASPPATPTPAAVPRAVENPPDVRARMPLRPTPPQPETKFPPPQQSAEEEERLANKPGEPDLLHVEPAVFLDGQPFPDRPPYDPNFPEGRRVRYIEADASGPGDGSLEHPWKDLQQALCGLVPGDRLVVGAAVYEGSFVVGGSCRDGTAAAPIQVFTRHAFLKPAPGAPSVLRVERSHWQFWELQIALLDSDSAGFVTAGAGAHDIAVDQTHIYEGKGPAVRIEAGSSRVTLSNCHIHQSTGVRILPGASDITLVNNHIHHNRAASVRVGGEPAGPPARGITILGNRIHNDRGPGIELADCSDVSARRNKLSNYRPDEDDPESKGGEAVVIGSGAENVRVEENTILEASVAIRVGEAAAAAGKDPTGVVLARNYLENRLTKESRGLQVDRGRNLFFCNNILDHYGEPIRIAPTGVQRLSVANNLVLSPQIAFALFSLEGIALFDYNVFGSSGRLQAIVGAGHVDLESWIRDRMPHSRIVPADLTGRDLGKVVGFSPVDAGTPVGDLPYRGAAPDIGVAER